MPQDLQEMLMSLMYAVITVGVPIFMKWLTSALTNLFNSFTKKVDNDYAKRKLEEASAIVVQSVNYISQTYVDAVHKQGTFDKDSQQIAFAKAKDTAKMLLNAEAQKLITETYGDFDVWLTTKIESTIKENFIAIV